MATHNGYVSGGRLLHKGDITWADKTAWSDYTKWIEYTDTSIETETGAKGTPLRFESNIIDLGAVKYVYPVIRVGVDGHQRTVIEYSEVDSNMISPKTTIGYYTHNNAIGGAIVTYTVLDYTEPGYTDAGNGVYSSTNYDLGYMGFKARYIRLTTYVEYFDNNNQRQQPILYNVNTEYRHDTVERVLEDAIPGDFIQPTSTPQHYIGANTGPDGPLTAVNITPHHNALYPDTQPVIIEKSGAGVTFAVVDGSGNDIVDWTVDIAMKSLPEIHETPQGVERVRGEI